MIDKEVKIVTFSQLDEALEERQKPDRRTQKKSVPPDQDRRKQDRRTKASTKSDV